MSNQDTRIITTIGPDAGLTPEQLADFEARQNGIVSGYPDLLLVNGELDTELLPDTFKNEKGLLSWLKKAVEALRRNKGKVTASTGLALGSFMMGNGVANADYECIDPDYIKTIILDNGGQLDIGMCYGDPPTNPPITPPPTQPTIPPTQPTTPHTSPTTPTTPPPPLSPPTETTEALPSTSVLGTNGEHIYPDITIDLGGGVTTEVINTAKETPTTGKDNETLDSIDDTNNTPEVGVGSGSGDPGDTPPSNEGLSTSEKVAIATGAGIAILSGVLAFMVQKRRGNKEKGPETRQPAPPSGGRPSQSGGIPINRGGFSGPATTHRSIADK